MTEYWNRTHGAWVRRKQKSSTPSQLLARRSSRNAREKSPYKQNVISLIRECVVGENPTSGVEVGVHAGKLSVPLLLAFPKCHMVFVDGWCNWYDELRQTGMERPMHVWDEIYRLAKSRIESFATTPPTIVRKLSVEAAEQFAHDSFDFVFIDADHSYRGVITDVIAWLPRVRTGMLLFGHDYGLPQYNVDQAVQDAFPDDFGTRPGNVWWHVVKEDDKSDANLARLANLLETNKHIVAMEHPPTDWRTKRQISTPSRFRFTKRWFEQRNLQTWEMYLLKRYSSLKPIRMLQIGVWEGMDLIWCLQNILHPDSKVVAIDPWLAMPPKHTQEMMNLRYANACHNLSSWSNQVTILHGKSQEILPTLNWKEIDLAVIDGDHTAEAVYQDAINVLPRMRVGGWMIFDDVRPQNKYPGFVLDGLERFCSEYRSRVRVAWKHRYCDCLEVV